MEASWRDEYLKWLCGFANAHGGVLEVGRNDDGQVVGIEDADRLMEELPNKLRDLLGIVAVIELVYEDGRSYQRIMVEPCPVLSVSKASTITAWQALQWGRWRGFLVWMVVGDPKKDWYTWPQ